MIDRAYSKYTEYPDRSIASNKSTLSKRNFNYLNNQSIDSYYTSNQFTQYISEKFYEENNALYVYHSEKNDIYLNNENSRPITIIEQKSKSNFHDKSDHSENYPDTKRINNDAEFYLEDDINNYLNNLKPDAENSIDIDLGVTKKINFISNAHFLNKEGNNVVFDMNSALDSTIKEHSYSIDNEESLEKSLDDNDIVDYSEVGLYNFLKSLDLENLCDILINNGFDDYIMMIEQMKSNNPITHENLKCIGINIPGHRAKILIKLEEGR
jgi:hypothetical protein